MHIGPRSCLLFLTDYLFSMSERYKFVKGHAHFIPFAVVGWVDDARTYMWSSANPYVGCECDEA